MADAAPSKIGGAKTIGFATSIMLLINNITGPGVPSLPNAFVEAGWLLPLVCLLGVWLMTTLSANMYCEAMERMPGNAGFRGRAEYSTVVDYYFGRRWYLAAQISLNGALQSLNIISVVQSAQVMDVAISALFGRTCGLNLTPFPNVLNGTVGTIDGSDRFFSCINTADLTPGNGWGCHVVLTLGFVLTAAMAIPCGRWNLDDNMIIQQIAFVLTVGCWLIWLVASVYDYTNYTALPAINTEPQTGTVAGVLGTILFNFGFVTTVPSWVNEKEPGTRVNPVMWSSTTLCVVIFCVMGIPPAIAFAPYLQGPVTGTCLKAQTDPSFNCANDLMQILTQPQTAPWQSSRAASLLLGTSVYLFPIVAVVSSIPVFSIVIKYNLIENGASARVGFLWGVVFPWLAAFPLIYMPDILGQFINFSSLLFVAFTDFIVPFALFVTLQRDRRTIANSSSSLGSEQFDSTITNTGRLASCSPPLLNASAASDTSRANDGGWAHPRVEPHYALPCNGSFASTPKVVLAISLGVILTVLSLIATYLTIQQGTYKFDQQTCALVGN